jgi:hypothetical protein
MLTPPMYTSQLGPTDLAHDVISLAKEGVPLVENGLVLPVEVVPVRDAIFRL